VAVFGRESVLGLAGSLVSRESFGRYVVQVGGTATRFAVDRLHESLDGSFKVRELFRCFTEALLAQTFQAVACNAVHNAEARCCRWLLSTHDRVGRDDLPITHDALSQMLAVQRSTVTIVIGALQMAGMVRQKRGVITIIDRTGIEEAACECYGSTRRSFQRLLPKTYSDE
jgi:CRP-like cAMP-binding protein